MIKLIYMILISSGDTSTASSRSCEEGPYFEKWDILGGFEPPEIPPTGNMKIYENFVGHHSNCDSDMR